MNNGTRVAKNSGSTRCRDNYRNFFSGVGGGGRATLNYGLYILRLVNSRTAVINLVSVDHDNALKQTAAQIGWSSVTPIGGQVNAKR